MLEDTITESLQDILYSTYTGELSLLERVIENPHAGLFVRGSVLDVLGKLYLDGEISHEYLVTYLRKLIAARTYDEETEWQFSMLIQSVVWCRDTVYPIGLDFTHGSTKHGFPAVSLPVI